MNYRDFKVEPVIFGGRIDSSIYVMSVKRAGVCALRGGSALLLRVVIICAPSTYHTGLFGLPHRLNGMLPFDECHNPQHKQRCEVCLH